MYRYCFVRYFHTKARLPELDFTKPTSDKIKRQSLPKASLRGQCLFGLYPIELALKTKRRQFYKLFLSKTSDVNREVFGIIRSLAEQQSIPIEYTTKTVLDTLSFDRPHQGICLDCSPLQLEYIEQTEIKTDLKKIMFDLCLVDIRDPMNLGAIIRTGHFFGVDRIILTDDSCQPSPVASKASSGALEIMSIYKCKNLKTYLQSLNQNKDVALICATHRGNIPLQNININQLKKDSSISDLKRIFLLIGNEHEGVSDEISQLCHHNVSIQSDINSKVSSLNASVACALFLYHISMQSK